MGGLTCSRQSHLKTVLYLRFGRFILRVGQTLQESSEVFTCSVKLAGLGWAGLTQFNLEVYNLSTCLDIMTKVGTLTFLFVRLRSRCS